MRQLMSSNRYGESRAAYREVQERHEDIKRIEKTLGELAQLFNDVSVRISRVLAADSLPWDTDERPRRTAGRDY
jgi:t-SNARE complex subunit (syntaxin)